MSPIVVAVDGSKHCERVVDVACEIAKELGTSLVLIHVLRRMPEEPEGVRAFEESEHYKEAFTTYLEELGRTVTTNLSQRVAKQNVEFTTLIEFGNPVERIVEAARFQNARMIVVGLRGLHNVGLIRSLGSVSRRVIESASCPVL